MSIILHFGRQHTKDSFLSDIYITAVVTVITCEMVGNMADFVRTKEGVFVKRLFIGWLALHVLICVSVFVFYTIEGSYEQQLLNSTKEAWKVAEDFKAELNTRLDKGDDNITSDDIETVIDMHMHAESLGPREGVKVKWTAIRTFSFTHEYLSTIGFGQVVPQTVAGKPFSINVDNHFYSLGKYLTVLLGYVGIPLYVFNVVMWGQGMDILYSFLSCMHFVLQF